MKNKLISEGEIKIVNEIIEKVKELGTYHKEHCTTLAEAESSSDLEKLHHLMYIDFVKDLTDSAVSIKDSLAVSEEEFESIVTKDGKKVEDVLENVMMGKLMKMLDELSSNRD